MVIVHADTAGFEFIAIGRTEAEANAALIKRWETFISDSSWPVLPSEHMQRLIDEGSTRTTQIEIGEARIYGIDL